MVNDPKTIPAAEDGPLDVGTFDDMRTRAAEYRGEQEGLEEAVRDELGADLDDEQPEDFADLEDEDDHV